MPKLVVEEQACWFTFAFEHQRWQCSPELERRFDFKSGDVASSELIELLRRAGASAGHFAFRHGLIDASGTAREVVIVGESSPDVDGNTSEVSGYFVDVTGSDEQSLQRSVTDAITEISARRAAIEQAKGMLMLIYGVTSAAAFDLLKWRSQVTNTKLRDLAERIMADFQTLNSDGRLLAQRDFDDLLLTAHMRLDEAESA